MARKINGATGVTLALCGLLLTFLVACRPVSEQDTSVQDVSTFTPCQQEDGSGDGQTYPCVWDGLVRGNHSYKGARWIVYVSGVHQDCPAKTVQPKSAVKCLNASDWLDPSK